MEKNVFGEDVDYMELAREIKECLESTVIAVLATNEQEEGAWATPIYFTYDNKFNFYFMSDSKTKHVKDIARDPNVGLAIFMPLHKSVGFKVGLQISGIAEVVPDEDIEDVYMQRSMRLTGATTWKKDSMGGHIIKQSGGVFMRIKPISFNYTDRRHTVGDSMRVSISKLIKSSEFLA